MAQPSMKVLSLGLPRTGSFSMAKALTLLGYKNVHHGIDILDSSNRLAILERACDATFSTLPTFTGKPFTLEDWEAMFGSCEAATDIAGCFAPRMIETYPNAKVILVIRDFDGWYRSMDESVITPIWSFTAGTCFLVVETFFNFNLISSIRKIVLGLFHATTADEIRQNARMTYDRHNRHVMSKVAPGQLLVYRMGDGWKPLCEFLDKPIPNAQFPHLNESKEIQEKLATLIRGSFIQTGMIVMPWIMMVVLLVVSVR